MTKKKRMTEGHVTEIRLYYANHPGVSYAEIAKKFNTTKATAWRIVNKGSPVSETLPTKTRARAHKETKCNDANQRSPTAVIQARPRTEALIAGARNEATAIMEQLDVLLRGQLSRLDEVLEAEAEFKRQVKTKDGEGKYYLALQLNAQHNNAILGVKATLQQMGNMQRNIQLYFDNRQVHVHFDKDGLLNLLLNEVIYPVLQEELPLKLGTALTEKMQAKYLARLKMFEDFGQEQDP